jgi:hypothetical protein
MKPEVSIEEAARSLAELWANVAEYSSDIAYAKRSMYQAYLYEGFTPAEALELCKTI